MAILAGVLVVILLLGFLIYASASIGSGVYVKAMTCVRTQSRKVVLSFDDGPDPKSTPQVLDFLAERGIKAVFFCVGYKVRQHADIVARIRREGHQVGIHTWSHSPLFPLFGAWRIMKELKETQRIIEEVTGWRSPFFRPPFGVTTPSVARAVSRLGMCIVGWSARSFDTTPLSSRAILRRVRRRIRPGAIILLHDRVVRSLGLLQSLVGELDAQGYSTMLLPSIEAESGHINREA